MKTFNGFITEADSWTSPTPEEAKIIRERDVRLGLDSKEEQRRNDFTSIEHTL